MRTWMFIVCCLSSMTATAQFRMVQNSTNLSVNLPDEFAGADLTLESCSNLTDAAWTTVLQTNAAAGGEQPLGAVMLPDLPVGGSSTNSGGGGAPPIPDSGSSGSAVVAPHSVAVFYRASASTSLDSDQDGLNNIREYELGTDYRLADSDSDGLDDAWELLYSLDPLVMNGDDDSDGDGLSNVQEYQLGTSPSSSLQAASLNSFDLFFFQPQGQ